VYEFEFNMAALSVLFGQGHRIRLEISSSNFPRTDRNMNTGNPFGMNAEGIPALQTIYHEPNYPSYLDLPVIP
jgi:predicted acyl esterase